MTAPRRLLAAACVLALLLVGAQRPAAATPSLPKGSRSDRVLVRTNSVVSLVFALLRQGGVSVGSEIGDGWHVVKVPSGISASDFVDDLKGDTGVLDACLDLGVGNCEAAGSTIPAGGLMLASEVPAQGELLRIGADTARTRATGSGVRVAVVDTGLLEHDSLDGHVDTDDGYDFVDGDEDPTDETDEVDDDDDEYVDEDYGHGTFVASLVLAVAPDVEIVGYRVLNADGIGSTVDVAQGIMRAVHEGADVINLSVHVPSTATAILSAIEYAADQGVQVVVSSGNTGNGSASSALPGSGTMTVTAVDEDDVLADFATYGAGVTLSAPGVDLSVAYPSEDPDTAVWSGTSFSAALVSGGCALLHELEPTWTIAQVKDRILDTLVDIGSGNPGHEDHMGAGRLDLDAATE